jgi:hypothetical protein
MADFRNRLLVVAGMATLFAGLASAQSLTCAQGQAPGATGSGYPAGAPGSVAANLKGEYGPIAGPGQGISPTQPIELRSEGVTELVSDTVFVCVGTGGTTLQGQVTAFMGGNVPALAVTATAPILQVLDNTVGGACDGACAPVYYAGIVVPGTANVLFGTSGTAGVKSGIYTGGAVVFPSYNFILQVSNVRVNVTGLLAPTVPTPVTETVFAGAEGVASLFNSSPITVGFVLKSYTTSMGAPLPSYVVCEKNPGQDNGWSFQLTVSELFAGAFKTATAPTPTEAIPAPANIPGGEAGSFPSAELVTILGTRIKFVVGNIPAGVSSLVVPNAIVTGNGEGGTTLELDLVPSQSDTGAADPAGTVGSTTYSVPAAGGSVTVIYQVNTELLSVIKSFIFQPQLQWAANAIVGQQTAVTVTTTYAPSPATLGGTIVVPNTYLPYFANTAQSQTGPAWGVCETDLLFPFITTQNGFETGIAISNTAADPFTYVGPPPTFAALPLTTGQEGVCNLYFYGTGQSPAATTPVTLTATGLTSIKVGTTQDTVVSPYLGHDYLGYVIARCQFLYAHGFAFFTNAAPGITAAQQGGYSALVFSYPPSVNHPRTSPPRSEHLDE